MAAKSLAGKSFIPYREYKNADELRKGHVITQITRVCLLKRRLKMRFPAKGRNIGTIDPKRGCEDNGGSGCKWM